MSSKSCKSKNIRASTDEEEQPSVWQDPKFVIGMVFLGTVIVVLISIFIYKLIQRKKEKPISDEEWFAAQDVGELEYEESLRQGLKEIFPRMKKIEKQNEENRKIWVSEAEAKRFEQKELKRQAEAKAEALKRKKMKKIKRLREVESMGREDELSKLAQEAEAKNIRRLAQEAENYRLAREAIEEKPQPLSRALWTLIGFRQTKPKHEAFGV